MNELLFMFLAQAVAAKESEYRTGARHALMLFASASDIDSARTAAIAGAESLNWTLVDVKREQQIDYDPADIEDEVLSSAAKSALETGSSTVVYRKEIPLDS